MQFIQPLQFDRKRQAARVEDEIQYTGLLRSQLATGGPAPPEIAIIRNGEKASRRLAATEDSELQPGDVIEVTLRRGSGPAATQ